MNREQAAHTTAGKPRQWSVSGQTCNASTLLRFNTSAGFTLAELLISVGVLVLLVLLFSQLLNSAATTMTLGNKRMDADSQARQLLDRMAIDFDQMLKRSDVSYYLKTTGNTEPGSDQISFFSAVPGYYNQDGYNSKASLVGYRINADPNSASYNHLERMGKGLALNGAYTNAIPLLFLDSTTNPTTTIQNIWPAATSSTAADSDYETAGPQVFRFEYYYLLKGQVVGATTYDSIFTDTPWDTRIPGHVDVNGMQDVAAIVVDIAVVDPRSRTLLTDAQLASVAGQLVDYSPGTMTRPGDLRSNWQNALSGITTLPRPTISGIRLYERYFYLYQ
jgi:hypothetical protein